MALHKSDSTEQKTVESHILKAVEVRLGLQFDQSAILGIGVQPDGIDPVRKVIVEVYAHVGRLKGAQLHKVKADLLKLVFIENKLGPGWRKIICFGSAEAAAFLTGTSWAAEAARSFGVEILVEHFSVEHELMIKGAQERQRMVNTQ